MALMRRMNKPLWETGNVVIMDGGFCVLKGFLLVYMREVFVAVQW